MAYTARSEAEVKEFLDTPEELQRKIKRLAHLVKKSKFMVAYTGAGISTSCGIADYRSGINTILDTGAGKWAKNAAIADGKLKKGQVTSKKQKVSTFKAIPSASHMALVALAEAGYLKHLVSQNTDGLHRRSGFQLNKLSELHGNGTLEDCSLCGKVYMRDYRCSQRKKRGSLAKLQYISDQIQISISNSSKISHFLTDSNKQKMILLIFDIAAFIKKQKESMYLNKINKQKNDKIIEENKAKRDEISKEWGNILSFAGLKLPRYLHHTNRFCAVKGCGAQLQDTIINFGENLPEETLETAQNKSSEADLYLVLGSSCTVTPAADMPEEVGLKWENENEVYFPGDDEEINIQNEPVHNLVICNLQKTPLHNVCSLPVHSKIDDLMIGLMKELDLKIPKWYLQRFIKINIKNTINNQKQLCISGIDRDGTNFTLFKSLILRNNGKKIRKIINNKDNVEDEYNYIISEWDINMDVNNNDDEKKNDDNSKGLTVELEFCGNYLETKLIISLNKYLDDFIKNDGNLAIKMIWDPENKIWEVPDKKQQLMDKNVKLLWSIGKDKGDDNEDQEEHKNDE